MEVWLKYVLDLAVVALIVFAVWRGVSKGFVITVYNTFRWLVCIILAQILYPYVSQFLTGLGLEKSLAESFAESFAGTLEGAGGSAAIESLPLPEFLKALLNQNDNSTVYELLGVSTATEYVSAYLAHLAVDLLSIILLVVILLVGTWLIGRALDILTKLPVVKQLNKGLGAVSGFVLGILYVWLFGAVLYLVSMLGKVEGLWETIPSTYILNWVNGWNPLLKWVISILN